MLLAGPGALKNGAGGAVEFLKVTVDVPPLLETSSEYSARMAAMSRAGAAATWSGEIALVPKPSSWMPK